MFVFQATGMGKSMYGNCRLVPLLSLQGLWLPFNIFSLLLLYETGLKIDLFAHFVGGHRLSHVQSKSPIRQTAMSFDGRYKLLTFFLHTTFKFA